MESVAASGLSGSKLAKSVRADPPYNSHLSVTAIIIGLSAGIFPALRASRLTPVEAIRGA